MILVITVRLQLCIIIIVSCIVEKIVAIQLSNHLASSNLLHPHQGAYQHSKSTEDILLVAVDIISLDTGNFVCATFLGS